MGGWRLSVRERRVTKESNVVVWNVLTNKTNYFWTNVELVREINVF